MPRRPQRKPDTFHASTPGRLVRRTFGRKREIRESYVGNAKIAVGEITKGCEIFGFTKCQFSLVDLIRHLLDQTGPAEVALATWTSAVSDLREMWELSNDGRITGLRWLFDYAFAGQKGDEVRWLIERFGEESIRLTKTHAKFVLLENDDWSLAVRTSMNLNANPKLENYEISDDPELAGYFRSLLDEIWETQRCGLPVRLDWAELDQHFSGLRAANDMVREDAPTVTTAHATRRAMVADALRRRRR